MKIAFYKDYHSGTGKQKDTYYNVLSVTVWPGGIIGFSHQPTPTSPREYICCNLKFKIICEAADDPSTIKYRTT